MKRIAQTLLLLCMIPAIMLCLGRDYIVRYIYIYISAQYKQVTRDVKQPENLEEMRSFIASEKLIIHAGGYITGQDGKTYTYTNCLEALDNSYKYGNRIVEIDFRLTDDGVLVCGHQTKDPETWVRGVPVDENGGMTEQTFMESSIYDEFTTMRLCDLASYMYSHPDLYIVTDMKSDINNVWAAHYIAETYPDLVNRFIIQIYNLSEYEGVKEAGFPYIILTLYRVDFKETPLDMICGSRITEELVGITFSYKYIENEEKMSLLTGSGTPLYTHTVNKKKTIREYLGIGITAVYTDRTDSLFLMR